MAIRIKERYPREVLLRMKWDGRFSLDVVEVTYADRCVPEGAVTRPGRDITSIGRAFLVFGDAHIPYHRILRITHAGETVFERRARRGDDNNL